jgi:hypothetical protein
VHHRVLALDRDAAGSARGFESEDRDYVLVVDVDVLLRLHAVLRPGGSPILE